MNAIPQSFDLQSTIANLDSESIAGFFNRPDDPIPLTTQDRWRINLALTMVDTIRVRFPFFFKDDEFRTYLKYRGKEKENGFMFYAFQGIFQSALGAKVRVFWFPRLWDRKSYLAFEFSVPKLVIGNNYTRILWGTDILARMQQELVGIYQMLDLPPLEIADGLFSRLDISENFAVGEDLDRYIAYIGKQSYPRRRRMNIANPKSEMKGDGEDNGVSFRTNKKWLSFYDKLAESGEAESWGKLRMELSLRSTDSITQLFGFKQVRVRDLNFGLCQNELNIELEKLALDRPIFCMDSAEEQLLQQLGYRESNSLVAFITHERNHPGLSAKDLAERLGTTPKTVNLRRKQLQELPFAIQWDSSYPELPPLHLSIPPAKLLAQVMAQSGVEKDSNTCARMDNPPMTDGGTDAEGTGVISASIPVILCPAPIELIPGEPDDLLSALFGKPTILVPSISG